MLFLHFANNVVRQFALCNLFYTLKLFVTKIFHSSIFPLVVDS